MKQCHEILASFFRGEKKYYVPEIAEAFGEIKPPAGRRLILRLRDRLEAMSGSEWPLYARELVHVFADAETDELKTECFGSVLLHGMPDPGPGPKRSWALDAKRAAAGYLSAIGSREASDMLAKALESGEIADEAAAALRKTVYGRMLLEGNAGDSCVCDNVRGEEEPPQPAAAAGEPAGEPAEAPDRRPARGKGRIRRKYLRRKLRRAKDGTGYFTCTFCGFTNRTDGVPCSHVVYAWDGDNLRVTAADAGFLNSVKRQAGGVPAYAGDFDGVMPADIGSEDAKITPGVLDAVFELCGIPDPMKSLTCFTDGRIFYYTLPDEDLEKTASAGV